MPRALRVLGRWAFLMSEVPLYLESDREDELRELRDIFLSMPSTT
jgi:hypothetical protein